ncbi:MAG: hypothetical protein AAGB22_06735, partial [Bacteroidota bacterium]
FELRFRSNPLKNGKRIKVAGGLKIGFMVNQHDKFKNDDGDKFKTYIFPNLKTWRFTVTGRIAYGKVGASRGYSLSSLFDDGRGPTVTPLSIGISIIPF